MQILDVRVLQLPKDEVIPQAWASLQGKAETKLSRQSSLLTLLILSSIYLTGESIRRMQGLQANLDFAEDSRSTVQEFQLPYPAVYCN